MLLLTRRRLPLLLAALIGGACTGEPASDSAPSNPPTASASASSLDAPEHDAWLIDASRASGLVFTHMNGMSGQYYFPEMLPAGAGVLDFDNDGDLDVYLVQGHRLGNGDGPTPSDRGPLSLRGQLFRNDPVTAESGEPSVRFTDVTEESGIDAPGYGMGVAVGDVTNDGCVDLYLTNFGPNQLFRNNCDGTFTDVSRDSGTDDTGWAVSASFVDYDRDGWLDLYVGNYVQYQVETDRPCTSVTGRREYCTPEVYPAQVDRLYRNQGGGRFADVTATALREAEFGPALGVSAADFDGDGWTDIYVANDVHENLLWINQRDGTFRDLGLVSGAALSESGRTEASMGVDAGDYDNDGDLDLFMTHLPVEGNNLYENDGNGLFEDVSIRARLGPLSLGLTGFGTAWIDVDNDGWLDLLAVNGAIEAIDARGNQAFPYDEPNRLYRNLRDGRFEDVTATAGQALALSEVSRGAAFGDIDNDGDTDVVVNNNNGPARLFLNRIGSRQHWIGLNLVGPQGRPMLGALVEILHSEERRVRHVHTDGSYASARDPRVLVGLGQSAEPRQVRVTWPGGEVEVWDDVPVDVYTTLTQGDGSAPR